MLSVIIKSNGEDNVVKLTYENIWRELKDISDSELIVSDHWNPDEVSNRYVCFLEADCLVNSGYFTSQMGLFKKNPMYRKLAMLSSAVAVNDWHNRFYGYELGNHYTDGVLPIKDKKSTKVYPVQIGYVPGAIMRVGMLKKVFKDLKLDNSIEEDLVYYSTQISLAFWRQGDGNPVHINPNTTYVTTEDYVNDIGKFDTSAADLVGMFSKESI